MINKEQLERYADLKIQRKLIDNELEFLNEEVAKQVAEFMAENEGKAPAIQGKGSFSIKKLKSWKYSKAYEAEKEALAALKAEEEATGVATFTETESVIFTQEKV